MKEIRIFIIVAFLLSACGHNENWTEFQGKGLPSSNYQTLKIVDDHRLYIGGRRTETVGKRDDEYIFENYCALYHSSDFGRTWTEINLGRLKGEVYFIRKNQDNLVLLNQSVTHDSTTVLKSIDNGETWESVFSLPKTYFISDIELRQNGIIELISRAQQNQRVVFRIADTIIDTIRFEPEIKHLHFSEKGFKGIEISNDNFISFISFDLQGNEIRKKAIEVDKVYSYSKRTANNDILWYDSYASTNILLFRNDELYEIDLSSLKDYRVKELYIEDSLIILDGFFNKDVAFLGVIHTFMVSHDFGQTWQEEDIPSPMYVKPSDLKDGRFISYAGIGRLQERK